MERREAGKKEQVSARGTRLSMQHRVPSLGTSQTCHEDRHETMILKGSNTTHRTSDAYSSNIQRSQKNNHGSKSKNCLTEEGVPGAPPCSPRGVYMCGHGSSEASDYFCCLN